jgi:arsenate reductase
VSPQPYRILFVCTGNSARSQLAEGLANHLGAGQIEAESAGTFPVGVNRYAVEVLQEIGLDPSRQYSKGLDDVPGPFDLVITLCDSARGQCPAPLLSGEHEHWSTPDPSFVPGGPDAIRQSFREVRDRLQGQIQSLVDRVHHGRQAGSS